MPSVLSHSIPSGPLRDFVLPGAESTPSGQIAKLDLALLRKKIGFEPHEKQWEILKGLKRFNIIPGGKRVGKSKLNAYLALLELLQFDRTCWVVAPSYELAERIGGYLEEWANLHLPFLRVVKSPNFEISHKAFNSVVRLKTADNPTNLKGEALTQLIIDEANDVQNDIWESYLQPNVRERFKTPSGWHFPRCFFIGNTGAKHWFYDLYQHGLKGDPEYFSYHLPTAIEDSEGNVIGSNNPEWITVDELKKTKETTSKHIWDIDWLANFSTDEGSIFKNLQRIKAGTLKKWNPQHTYVIGWDPAKHKDFNVITVVDQDTHEVVAHSRSNKLDYVFQKERIKSYVREYGNAKVIIDSTGLGEPLFDELLRSGVRVTDYKFTQKSKQDLVEKLVLLIEHGQIKIPPELKELYDELELFGTLDKQGRLKYEAPQGKHDDCVISLALACWELSGDPRGDVGLRRDNYQIEKIRQKTKRFQYR